MTKINQEVLSFFDMDVLTDAQRKYNLTDEDAFKLFIVPALDDAVRNNKKLIFPFVPNLPIGDKGSYSKEWEYLRDKHGYTSFHKEGEVWVLDKEK